MDSRHKVRFVLFVVGDTGSCLVYRNEELPFPPCPGMQIAFSDDEEEGREIAEVTWQTQHQRFVAAFEPWDDQPFPFEEQLAHLKECGWSVDQGTLRWKRAGTPTDD